MAVQGGWQEERVDANSSLALDITDFEMLKGVQSFEDASYKVESECSRS